MNGPDAGLRWQEIARRPIASCAVFDVYASERTSADGRRGEFVLLDAPDWVTVVPVLDAPGSPPAFLMVRQFRHGAAMITTEFPAGLVEPGEDPRQAAQRELLEETGQRAGRLTPLGKVQPNPAFMGNWCHLFLAEDLARVHGGQLDELEALQAVTVPAVEVERLAGTGEYINSLVLVALSLYHRVITERG